MVHELTKWKRNNSAELQKTLTDISVAAYIFEMNILENQLQTSPNFYASYWNISNQMSGFFWVRWLLKLSLERL